MYSQQHNDSDPLKQPQNHRLLTAGEIPHAKRLNYKAILEVLDEKYT